MLINRTTSVKSYGYIIFAACFSIQAVGIGCYVAYGVFFNELMLEFQWPRAVISGASSLAFFMMGVFGILIGRLNDRYGPRLLMTATSFFFGVGFILMSQVNSILQLYIFYGILFGIGLSSIDVIALSTIARWFSLRRGAMTGLVKVGTGAGQFSIPLIASLLIGLVGWRHTYLIIGSVASIILFGVAQVLKRDHQEYQRISKRDTPSIRQVNNNETSSLSFKKAKKTLQLWNLCVVNFMVIFCLLSILIHIVPHARDIGLSTSQAAGVLSTIGGVSMIGRFVSGLAIDRYGSRTIMISCLLLLITALFWLQVAESPWMLFLFACFYGLAHGGLFTAVSPIVAEIFGIKAHGTILGIVVCFGTTGGAIGPIIAGQIFDMAGSYTASFWSLIIISACSLGILSLLKPVKNEGL
ncbi:MAG: MFS transporter [Desulfobacterales bacterium]|nr:MFS transporter [Desulfobacterales bacterium]